MREFCARKGWTVAGEFVDAGISGKTLNRPQMQALLKLARSQPKPFDVIAVHKLDRFSRSIFDTIGTLDELRKREIGFASVTEDFDFTTPVGKVLLTLLASFAEIYLDNLSAETKKGKAERARKGLQNGSIPYGYTRGEDGVPVFHARNLEGYRLAVGLCASGKRLMKIVDALNAQGYRTSGNWGARLFSRDTLLPLLKNRFYLGELRHGGGWLPGRHAAAIDVETWQG